MHLETDEKETSTTFEKEIPRHVEKDSSKNVETTKLLDEKSRMKKSERTNFAFHVCCFSRLLLLTFVAFDVCCF